ncbi:hypothetical protein ACILG0_11630 [Pseudomonadota bacterium AL_CKDN230030165-1A_HGKHYDSX7]
MLITKAESWSLNSYAAFRRDVLETLARLRAAHPEFRLLCMYDPTLADPVGWADDARRAAVPLRHAAAAGSPAPRLIEFDCRKVAAYLLETDAALDDPAFEATVTQAYAYVQAGAQVLPDDPGRAFCGWLHTGLRPRELAERNARASGEIALYGGGRWRLHDPRALSHVWHALSVAQREAVLGVGTVWFAIDPEGRPRTMTAGVETTPTKPIALWNLTDPQRELGRNAGLVNRLLSTWRQARAVLPSDAAHRLHRRLAHPFAARLDGVDRARFVLATVELQDSFSADARWVAAFARYEGPGTLGDALAALPAEAYADHLPVEHDARGHVA